MVAVAFRKDAKISTVRTLDRFEIKMTPALISHPSPQAPDSILSHKVSGQTKCCPLAVGCAPLDSCEEVCAFSNKIFRIVLFERGE